MAPGGSRWMSHGASSFRPVARAFAQDLSEQDEDRTHGLLPPREMLAQSELTGCLLQGTAGSRW